MSQVLGLPLGQQPTSDICILMTTDQSSFLFLEPYCPQVLYTVHGRIIVLQIQIAVGFSV